MPAHIIVTIAILFACMIACCFSASRGASQILKGDKPSIIVSYVIPFVNILLICSIVIIYLAWMPSSRVNGKLAFQVNVAPPFVVALETVNF